MCAIQDRHRNIVIEKLKDKDLKRWVLIVVYHAYKKWQFKIVEILVD